MCVYIISSAQLDADYISNNKESFAKFVVQIDEMFPDGIADIIADMDIVQMQTKLKC